jgi:putative FmdB family regulatory protein
MPKGRKTSAMPIYEFYCPKCHMLFNFFSSSVNTEKRPPCPKCGKIKLDRQMSTFSSPRNRGEEEDVPLPDMDESKMEQAMGLLSQEAEHMDENDPRQAANLMRKLTEKGEDPEQIEAEMGDLLEEEEPFSLKEKASRSLKKRPPRVDEKLYYL